ncbi:hypothetical protein K502DRAFT_339363 [Neoconidiobolus thromboides FSU 785]|nr:hypothetical protein K502DRAFT_339363 [Neoconidiobolus thromboides FSU 785]
MKLSLLIFINTLCISKIAGETHQGIINNEERIEGRTDDAGYSWVRVKAKSLSDKLPTFFKHNPNNGKEISNETSSLVSNTNNNSSSIPNLNSTNTVAEGTESKSNFEINKSLIEDKDDKRSDEKGIKNEKMNNQTSSDDSSEFAPSRIFSSYYNDKVKGKRPYSSFLDDKDMIKFKENLDKILDRISELEPGLYKEYQESLNSISKKSIYYRSINIWKAIGDYNRPNPFPTLSISLFLHGWLTICFPLFFSIASLTVFKTFYSLYFTAK